MGLAKKLEGNPEDAISQGKLCARGQAAIQITYHPDRLDKPKKRSGERGSGQFVDITWDEAIKELTGKLNELAAANDQASLAFLTKPRRGRRLELIAAAAAALRREAAGHLRVVLGRGAAARQRDGFGSHQLPTFDLENARYVISFGADFLGTWNSAVAQSAAYGRMRQAAPACGRSSCTSMRGCRRPRPTPTSSWRASPAPKGCSRWRSPSLDRHEHRAVRPSTRRRRLRRRPALPVDKIERLAREFAANGPAVAIIGGAPLAHTNGLFHAQAVNDAESRRQGPESARRHVVYCRRAPPVATRRFSEILRGAAPKVLLIDDVNPVYCVAGGVEGRRRAEARAVHRQLRIVHRRNQRARGSDPAGSFVPRVVGRCGAGERIGEGGRRRSSVR